MIISQYAFRRRLTISRRYIYLVGCFRKKEFPERRTFGEWVLFDVMCLLLLSSYAADTGHIITGLIAVLSTDISYFLSSMRTIIDVLFCTSIIERVISISAT